jgi:predicted Zn-dependent protease
MKSQSLQKLGRLEDAITCLEQRAPLSAFGCWQLGRALAEVGRDEEAEKQFRYAIAEDPDRTVAVTDLALLLCKKGNTNEATQLCETTLNTLERNSDEWSDLANSVAWTLYVANTQLAFAKQLAVQALNVQQSSQQSWEVLHTVLAIHCRADIWDTANEYFRRYVLEYPISELVGERWCDHVMFFRDIVKADRGLWASDRIVDELPAPRDGSLGGHSSRSFWRNC